jgi:translation initiation factor IF-2
LEAGIAILAVNLVRRSTREETMPEELIGVVTHYFAKPEVGVVKLSGELKAGAVVRFRGHTTDFEQTAGSLQVEHDTVESAAAGTEVAIKVKERVRKHDEVYRVTP